MKPSKFLRIAAVFGALSLLATACGDDDDTGAETEDDGGGGEVETYKIAFVGPLTGSAANLGIYIRDGAKTAVEEFNEANDDVEIELVEFDTQGDPTLAPGQFDLYVADEDILGIVGPAFSGETNAVLDLLEEEGLVMVSASATNVGLVDKGTSVFHRVLPDDAAQAAGIVKYLETKLQPPTIAIVHDNSDYGKGLAVDQLSAQMPASVEIVATEAIDPAGTDYSAAVNAVNAADPDAVFFGGYYEAAGRLNKQLEDAGSTAQFISGDGALDVGFIESAGAAAAEGALLTCPCYFASEASPGEIGEFATLYEEVTGTVPGTYSTEAYDAANILMTGIADGNTDRAALLSYVEGLTEVADAISKEVVFEENGNIEAQGIFGFKVEDGVIVLETATDEL